MRPLKNSVSIIIRNNNRKILLVKRPPNDENGPNLWSLPAISLKKGGSFEEAAIRTGKEKLGTTLEITKLENQGILKRKEYILFMKQFAVKIIEGIQKFHNQ